MAPNKKYKINMEACFTCSLCTQSNKFPSYLYGMLERCVKAEFAGSKIMIVKHNRTTAYSTAMHAHLLCISFEYVVKLISWTRLLYIWSPSLSQN